MKVLTEYVLCMETHLSTFVKTPPKIEDKSCDLMWTFWLLKQYRQDKIFSTEQVPGFWILGMEHWLIHSPTLRFLFWVVYIFDKFQQK